VVALKHGIYPPSPLSNTTKQERRGGIETTERPAVPECLGGKQERRGGIETVAQVILEGPGDLEAGTPWWH